MDIRWIPKVSKRFLFIFLDGVGLGSDNPMINPFARASMPCLLELLEGRSLVAAACPSQGKRYSLSGLDTVLGVEGMPQSASGQAALLTGQNVPKMIGSHYGPKPNDAITTILTTGNIFKKLSSAGISASLLNAYPQRFFDSINTGRRLLSAIPQAVVSAGLRLKTTQEYYSGNALSADFTGNGWREHLHLMDAPINSPQEAGQKMASLALTYDFSFFEFWLSDYAGHAQEMNSACSLLTEFDEMLCGLLASWDFQESLIFITSDHGNIEDLSTHRHTTNHVPALVIGETPLRNPFSRSLKSLIDVAPAILNFFELPYTSWSVEKTG
jgi:2,3-bisphosphoglycerate-independent phosphoglycerate mutase